MNMIDSKRARVRYGTFAALSLSSCLALIGCGGKVAFALLVVNCAFFVLDVYLYLKNTDDT